MPVPLEFAIYTRLPHAADYEKCGPSPRARPLSPAMQPLYRAAGVIKTVDESLKMRIARGAGPLSAPIRSLCACKCASEKEGVTPLSSLSQDDHATGDFGRSNAWRARTGPPEGAFDGFTIRPPPNSVRDHRNHLQSQITVASEPDPPRSACRRVAVIRNSVWARRPRTRYTLEDGVANAEAPSSREGSIRRVFEFVRRSLAAARIGMDFHPALAPQTDAPSEYCLTGH